MKSLEKSIKENIDELFSEVKEKILNKEDEEQSNEFKPREKTINRLYFPSYNKAIEAINYYSFFETKNKNMITYLRSHNDASSFYRGLIPWERHQINRMSDGTKCSIFEQLKESTIGVFKEYYDLFLPKNVYLKKERVNLLYKNLDHKDLIFWEEDEIENFMNFLLKPVFYQFCSLLDLNTELYKIKKRDVLVALTFSPCLKNDKINQLRIYLESGFKEKSLRKEEVSLFKKSAFKNMHDRIHPKYMTIYDIENFIFYFDHWKNLLESSDFDRCLSNLFYFVRNDLESMKNSLQNTHCNFKRVKNNLQKLNEIYKRLEHLQMKI